MYMYIHVHFLPGFLDNICFDIHENQTVVRVKVKEMTYTRKNDPSFFRTNLSILYQR